MRFAVAALALVLALPAAADVLVLKDGRKLSGRIRVAKDKSVEITVDSQKQVFDPDDVQKIIKSPKEIIGDADKDVDEAKKLYQQGVEIQDLNQADKVFRKALASVEKARNVYAEARDLFPDGYSDLDKQLMQIMMLMRLIRSRLGSQIASGPPTAPVVKLPEPEPLVFPEPAPSVKSPAGRMTLAGAIAVLADPAKRTDSGARAEATSVFHKEWQDRTARSGLGAAGYLYLSRSKEDVGALGDDAQKELDAFLSDLKEANVDTADLAALTAATRNLAEKINALRAADSTAPLVPLEAFAAGLAGCVLAGGEGEAKTLAPVLDTLGYRKSEYGDVWGTKESLAMDDFRNWMKSGDFGLAVVQFKKDYRGSGDFMTAYANSLLLLFKSIRDNRNYKEAAVSLDLLSRRSRGSEKEHVVALSKSIRANAPCASCFGTALINCSACKGKMKLTLQCRNCGGSGKVLDTLRGGRVRACRGCGGKGIFRNVDCPKCKKDEKATGKTECKARGCAGEVKTPTLGTFAKAEACAYCRGAGLLMNHVAFTCPECSGIGLFLHPRTDPEKTLR